MIPAIHRGAVQDALNAVVIHPVFDLSTSLALLPEALDDRFIIIDSNCLREGNCVASVILDASTGEQVVACCFQVILKTDTFVDAVSHHTSPGSSSYGSI